MSRVTFLLSQVALLLLLSATESCRPTEIGSERKVCDENLITRLSPFRDTLSYALAYRESIHVSLEETGKTATITFDNISLTCLPREACGSCPGNVVPVRLSVYYDEVCQPYRILPSFSCVRAGTFRYIGEPVQVGNMLISCVNGSSIPQTYEEIAADQNAFLRSFQIRVYVVRKRTV